MTAPVGAVNVMCFHRALHRGFVSGISAGLGAVVADALFAAIVVFGITAIASFIAENTRIIELVGGLLILVFGIKLWHTPPPVDSEVGDGPTSLLGGFATAFFMTITNPGAILGFIAVFSSLSRFAPAMVPLAGNYADAGVMVAGVATGSIIWWIGLSGIVTLFRKSIDEHWLDRANLVAGGALILFGGFVLVKPLVSLDF